MVTQPFHREFADLRLVVVLIACILAASATPVHAACDKDKQHTAPASRFVVNGAEAFDTSTKLTWRRCSEGQTWTSGDGCTGKSAQLTLAEAKASATQTGNGWRLPTVAELYSIVEMACENPAITEDIFPGVKVDSEGAPYWTNSPVPNLDGMTYYVDFSIGYADGHSEWLALAVRLVKTGK